MSLREQFETSENINGTDCRVWRWLSEFEDDDRGFLVELLERPDYATDAFVLWLRKNNITPPANDTVNHHRQRRCACPDGHGGRRI